MKVDILTPTGKLYSGEANSVSVPGSNGSFEILDNHAPIISSLNNGKISLLNKTETTVINTTGGFIEVLNNEVSILLETAVLETV